VISRVGGWVGGWVSCRIGRRDWSRVGCRVSSRCGSRIGRRVGRRVGRGVRRGVGGGVGSRVGGWGCSWTRGRNSSANCRSLLAIRPLGLFAWIAPMISGSVLVFAAGAVFAARRAGPFHKFAGDAEVACSARGWVVLSDRAISARGGLNVSIFAGLAI
jgi:hypothetical protein